VNIIINETLSPGNAALSKNGAVLLENPVGKSVLRADQLKSQVILSNQGEKEQKLIKVFF
jgi:hypothetical protein